MATKTHTLTLRLGPKLRAELDERARDAEMSVGEFVRYAVSEYIRTHPTDDQLRAEAEAIKEAILNGR